jgi:hypothetical protein
MKIFGKFVRKRQKSKAIELDKISTQKLEGLKEMRETEFENNGTMQ